MKKSTFVLSLITLFSSSAFANKQGFYVGADIGSNFVGSMYLDTNVGLTAGYDYQVSPKVVVGIEGEYRNLGQDNAAASAGNTHLSADIKASSFGLNIKPKYYFSDQFYGALIIGLHRYTYEEYWKIGNTEFGGKDKDNAFLFGTEAGYEIKNNVILRTGIKAATADLLGYKTDLGTVYFGVDYKFN
ncbi:porin family protein [Photobacterium makurazakiensis]|uniref:outer membrane beta-barrel protein n=1 Tax=Photobacterium makurazakiensis TaxID=2910234 RepID=UPI003D150957